MPIEGNYENKYESKNPASRLLVNRFLDEFERVVLKTRFKTALDVGCGEGYLLKRAISLKPTAQFQAIDISKKMVDQCHQKAPHVRVRVGNVSKMSFRKNSFDFVYACEILEHLNDPLAGLKEMARVGNSIFLITVPLEPYWRMLNMARLKYLTYFGNTPGHKQHFNRRSIRKLVEKAGLKVKRVKIVFPWIFLLAEK